MPASIKVAKLNDAREKLLENRWPRKKGLDDELMSHVKKIVEEVRKRGDEALIEFTEKFDGIKLDRERIRVSPEEVDEAYEKVDDEQISMIEAAKERIWSFQEKILAALEVEYVDDLGVKISWRPHPIESTGCYVPGGKFPYPSTLLMTTVPAKVAGVPRIVVCTPPLKNGETHPLILVAADICGVSEVYRVGGAQAIAAMAYGTESIKPVEKIVGPGNQYVVAAKLLISQDVPIDHPAGPSEIMILADEFADPYLITLDLISQAEHGPGSMAALVTTSAKLAGNVYGELRRVAGYLEKFGDIWILIADDMDENIEFINEFAPEHLEIFADDVHGIASKIYSPGLILIGDSTPAALSDYCLGTNHVLPTGGYGHIHQPLSVMNFIKFTCIAECSPEALRRLSRNAITLAESEGFVNHASAIRERVKD